MQHLPSPTRTPPEQRLASLTALFATLALSACGGNSDYVTTPPIAAPAPGPVAGTPAPAPVPAPVPAPAPTPAPAVSTTVSGAVVKGPVAGAQVCGYTVVANGRGAGLGSCTTSNASGNYTLTVPAGSGPLWLEATGGSYVDEATSATTNLPPGSPLTALVTANGGAVTTMLTPLTTLALNAARSNAGGNGTLDATAFNSAATQLLSSFNLPATLNITGTLPAFGSAANSYGAALAAVSQMVANGTTLAAILATANPQTLAASYARAATPGSGGTPSANGTLTVGGVTTAGAATSLTPQATGFEVQVTGSATNYRFFRETSTPASKVEVKVAVPLVGTTTVSYYDLANRSSLPFCSSNCGVTVSAASGATHPVTLTFASTPLSGGLTLTGSLVGDAPGAAWNVGDLAGATTSSLMLGGSSVRVLSSTDTTTDLGGGNSQRSVTLRLSDGSTLALSQSGSAGYTFSRILLPATVQSCNANCGVTLVDSTGSSRITFANSPLGSGSVLNGTVDFARTSGSLTSSDAGSFTPTASSVESLNDKRTLIFNVLGTAAQAGLSLLTLDVQGGRVVLVQATVGIATQVLSCFDNGAGIKVPACSGVTLAADGRTVTFNNTVLYGGAVGATGRNVTFNGTVVAKGP